VGGAGDDQLYGGTAVDRMEGGAGNDLYYFDPDGWGDTIIESAGQGTADRILTPFSLSLAANTANIEILTVDDYSATTAINLTGNTLNNTIIGNAGANTLQGREGDDNIQGREGNDILIGGAGNDQLIGGAGRDTFTGNVGADLFRFIDITDLSTSSNNADIITDFVPNATLSLSDRIHLSSIDANTGVAGDQAFTFIGTAAFTAAGQIRYATVTNADGVLETRLALNIDADTAAEAIIRFDSVMTPQASWFVL
jgi:Ca2+-binding RTX toxin-like protein